MRLLVLSLAITGRGGMETILRTVDQELVRRGHEISYVFAGPPAVNRDWAGAMGRRVLCLGQGNLEPPWRSRQTLVEVTIRFAKVLGTMPRPDVVLAPMMNTWIVPLSRMAMLAYGGSPPPLISWSHGSLVRLSEADRELVRYADAHLAIAAGLADELRAVDPGKPVALVHNPILDVGSALVPRPELPTFVYVGRLDTEQKRLDRLFRGFRGLDPDTFRLKLVGEVVVEGSDARGRLERMAEEAGIAPAVEWFGWQSDPWQAVGQATALILTSDWEGFPTVVGEALARGVPVISSDCPVGPRDLIMPGSNGWLFAPNDEDTLQMLVRDVTNGTMHLPSPEACAASVEWLRPERVVDDIETALETWRWSL